MEHRDIIIVGSGCTGAMVAQTFAEAGVRICMLDTGELPAKETASIPDGNFEMLRKTDPQQYRYLLGMEVDASIHREIKTGAQLTPPRRYLIQRVSELLPLLSANFFPMESLAYGGLGGGWGLGSCVFSPAELNQCGLDEAGMLKAYQWVADRIGISGADDAVKKYTTAHLQGIQEAVEMDENGRALYSAYQMQQERLNARGLFMGRSALALLTAAKD